MSLVRVDESQTNKHQWELRRPEGGKSFLTIKDSGGIVFVEEDIELSRIAANILGLAAGDSFRIPSDGQQQFGTDVILYRGGTDLLYTPDRFAIGTLVADLGIGLSIDITSTSAIKGYNTIIARQRGAVTSGPSSVQIIGISGEAIVEALNTQNWTHPRALVGIDGYVATIVGATGTITGIDALSASADLDGGVITTYRGVNILDPRGAVNPVNVYGLYIEAITKGSTISRAIQTMGGLTALRDATAPLRLEYSAAKYVSFAIDVNGILTITPDTGGAVVLDQSNRWRPAVNNGLDLGKNDIQWSSLYLGNNIYISGSVLFQTDGATINSPDIDATSLILKARDNGVGLVEIARFQGAADPYFEAYPLRLKPIATASLPGTPVEGMLVYDTTAKKLKVRVAAAWETVTSA